MRITDYEPFGVPPRWLLLRPETSDGPVALASSVQVDACTPNALIQEQSLDIHYDEDSDVLDYLGDPAVFEYDDGYVEIPDGPGLGIEVDESVVRERAGEVNWHDPVRRHDDGSVAEQ